MIAYSVCFFLRYFILWSLIFKKNYSEFYMIVYLIYLRFFAIESTNCNLNTDFVVYGVMPLYPQVALFTRTSM